VIAQRIRGRSSQQLIRKVPVVRGRFSCKLRLRAGIYRIWAETAADASNLAGSSLPLRVHVA
jgi:hypothetical protein